MGWKVYSAIAGTFLALVFGLLFRRSYRDGTKALGRIKEMKDEEFEKMRTLPVVWIPQDEVANSLPFKRRF